MTEEEIEKQASAYNDNWSKQGFIAGAKWGMEHEWHDLGVKQMTNEKSDKKCLNCSRMTVSQDEYILGMEEKLSYV